MSVVLVDLTVKVPKETEDVRQLLLTLVQDIKDKKSVVDISADALPKLIAAVDGWDKLGEEAKTKEAYDCFALTGSGIAKILVK